MTTAQEVIESCGQVDEVSLQAVDKVISGVTKLLSDLRLSNDQKTKINKLLKEIRLIAAAG